MTIHRYTTADFPQQSWDIFQSPKSPGVHPSGFTPNFDEIDINIFIVNTKLPTETYLYQILFPLFERTIKSILLIMLMDMLSPLREQWWIQGVKHCLCASPATVPVELSFRYIMNPPAYIFSCPTSHKCLGVSIFYLHNYLHSPVSASIVRKCSKIRGETPVVVNI